jgi:hypothetical protein
MSNQNTTVEIAVGTIHEITEDIKKVLLSNPSVLEKWNKLTPLARNEWICWVTIVKKQETRDQHLVRLCEDILGGHKRPCCWPGCPHHRPDAAKWFKNPKKEIKYKVSTK